GTMTGAAGGVFRDVFINEIPLIFRKEIYALACIIGGLFYGLFDWLGVDLVLTQCLSGFSVFLVRILAVKFHLGLPILKGGEAEE
ncbi:MAG: TRIC cation channel family protein, partial [Planctomycetia bacterium]|nr:TRIC cation channel family protein [Planctomycetia bacterium]